ncbi:uncharacterized protein LOC143597325 [Bidens hawaiensis]|uniref:uncharacterized protein LOC143597325 n=1 Tax=Bidens hawaiensis TaxID=980011 RepID=UPI00404945A3
MGCVGSKPEDSPAVDLCRKRCHFLDEAIHQRYVLAEAHLAYFYSLKSLGDSLHRFFDLHSDGGGTSPVPANKKGDVSGSPVAQNSGSGHIHFHSDSDEDDASDDSLHLHSEHGGSSPPPAYGDFSYSDQNELGYAYPPAGGYTVNYMKKQTTPSVMYQQRPINSEPIHFGYNNQNPDFNSNDYSNFGEFFASSSHPPPYGGFEEASSSSNSKTTPPPPPPPPPAPTSGWDFLNPFESYEPYYPPYTPSQDSREVREEEGIPDLEDEDLYQQEVVKEVHGNQKFVDSGGGSKKPAVVDEESVPNVVAKEEDSVEYEVHVVDKQVVEDQKKPATYNNDSEVVKEIQTQFYRASESGNELAKILEVWKVPHNRKHNAYQAPSKMLNGFTPLLSLAPPDPADLDVDVDLLTKSKNLSSTLHKLYLWEKKLFDEVKIEEKMRLLHEEKKRKLVRMDEKGAEHHKVDATRSLVRSLSTKIRIAIQVVEKISQKINNLRDEELWPQLNDFLEGLTRMWRSMQECHHIQCEAINPAKRIDSIASHKHSSDTSLDATLKLEHELLNWAIRFSCWFGAQKGFVKALNEWLLKCLMYEPEQTVDGPVPYSPGRLGAPAIFVICNQWAQAMQSISEKEVVESMRNFATNVLQLWERDKVEMRQRTVVDKNQDRNMDKEDQKIHKELQMLDRMIIVSSGNDMSLGHHVYQSETSKAISLQTSLQRVFESMEQFTAASLKAYEELLRRIQEDGLSR